MTIFEDRTKSRHQPHLNPQHEQPTADRFLLQESQRQAMNSDRISRRHRYSPYGQNYSHLPLKEGHRSQLRQQSTTNHVRQPRSLLERQYFSPFPLSPLLIYLTSHLQRHGMTSPTLMHLLNLEMNQAETSTLEQVMVRFISVEFVNN